MVEFDIQFGNSFKGLQALANLMGGIGKAFDVAGGKATNFLAKLQKPIDFTSMGNAATQLNAFAQNMQRSADAVMGFMQPGINFEKKMAELSAGTGVTGKALKDMGNDARKLAVDLGLPADQIADVYLQNLSKLSPELAKTTEGQKALASMGKTTAMLAKGMEGDVAGASDALTTMMNAYNVDMSKPEEAAKKMAMIADMLTVSFKEGAINVPDLSKSMKALGATGYMANVGLAEVLATTQILGQKGAKVGAEGGVALRNAIAQLGQGELMPAKTLALLKAAGVNISALTDKTADFTDRMAALKPIMKNDALLGEFFGKENVVGGQAILQNLAQIEDQTKKTQNATGQNEAYAKQVSDTVQGRLDRMGAAFNDLAISAFDSLKPYVPMISLTSQMAVGISSILPMFGMMGTMLRATAGGLLKNVFGITAMDGALVFNQKSLLGSILSLARWAGTMVVNGVASLGIFLASLGATTAGTWLFNTALSANPIGVIVIGIGVLVGAMYGLFKLFMYFADLVGGVGTLIKEYNPFSLLAKAIDYLFGSKIMESMRTFFDWVEEKIMWLWEKIKGLGEILGLTTAEVNAKAGETENADYKKQMKELGLDMADVGKNTKTDLLGVGSEMSKLPTLESDKSKSKTQKGLEGVAGGGSKQTNITINLQKLQDKIEVHTMSVKEGAVDIERQMTELLMRVLNSTNQYQAG